MNQTSGYIEITVDGEIIAFKFGTNAYALFCEMNNIELHEIPGTNVFGEVDKKGKVIKPASLLRLRELFFCGYKANCLINKIPQKYDIYQITELIEKSDDAVITLQMAMARAKLMGFKLTQEADPGNPQKPGS